MQQPHQPNAEVGGDSSRTTSGLWVFGYGSLCWHPGFEFDRSVTGYVRGFARKFWQGNTTHRGTDEKPGRVATLIDDKEGIVWGRAFEVRGEAALPYLNQRECKLGGYLTQFTTFFPRHKSEETTDPPPAAHPLQPFPALLYIATPTNCHWLGDAPLQDIARQIVDSEGRSGHNVEYLMRLADFMHEMVPEANDDHLFGLECLVQSRVTEMNLCMKTLMGDKVVTLSDVDSDEDEVQAGGAAGPAAVNTFEYASRVQPKKLRCLNI